MEISSRIKIFRGKEIYEFDVRNRIKKINLNRYIKLSGFVSDPFTLEKEEYGDCDFCVIGTGWYLFYSINEKTVNIDLLQSLDDNNTLVHAVEMMAVLKELLLAYQNYTFKVLLNENSLRLYQMALKKGYIKTLYFNEHRLRYYTMCTFIISESYKTEFASRENKIIKFGPKR